MSKRNIFEVDQVKKNIFENICICMEHNKAKVDVCIDFRAMYFSMSPAKQNFNPSVFIEYESERGRALHKNSKRIWVSKSHKRLRNICLIFKKFTPKLQIFGKIFCWTSVSTNKVA